MLNRQRNHAEVLRSDIRQIREILRGDGLLPTLFESEQYPVELRAGCLDVELRHLIDLVTGQVHNPCYFRSGAAANPFLFDVYQQIQTFLIMLHVLLVPDLQTAYVRCHMLQSILDDGIVLDDVWVVDDGCQLVEEDMRMPGVGGTALWACTE